MYVSRSPLGMSHSQHKMPVGIQMFATITSKHHFQTLQRDLRGLASGPRAPRYEDTLVVCSDGSRQASRLILGLILPELATVTSFSLLPEVTLLMPEHSTADLDRKGGETRSHVAQGFAGGHRLAGLTIRPSRLVCGI